MTAPLISVAPMLDWTTRHCRYFHRLLSPSAILYTEMISTGAILHGETERFLQFNPEEHPVIIQLGGSDPKDLAECAKLAENQGYNGVNLNCGCPSDRVQNGAFGACLMNEPKRVAECITAITQSTSIPISVKCRIGIDHQDSDEFLNNFIDQVSAAGCKNFTIHARKAWLKGLSPKENREIPELNYDRVRRLRDAYPNLNIGLNGGITTRDQIKELSPEFYELMIGREAYQNPYFLAEIEHELHGTPLPNRKDITLKMANYAAEQIKKDVPVKSITRHILGLFQGQRGAKKYRQILSTLPYETGADESCIHKALEYLD